MYSGFDSFGLDGGEARFVSGFGGYGASFCFSGGGGEVSLDLSTAWSPAFFGSSGAFSFWGLAVVFGDYS